MAAEVLDTDGYDAAWAVGDAAAYDHLNRDAETFAAMIVDLDLGRGTTGFDVARHARALRPDLPVLYISGVDDGSSVGRFGVPGSSFLRKPFTPDELIEQLQLQLEVAPSRRSAR